MLGGYISATKRTKAFFSPFANHLFPQSTEEIAFQQFHSHSRSSFLSVAEEKWCDADCRRRRRNWMSRTNTHTAQQRAESNYCYCQRGSQCKIIENYVFWSFLLRSRRFTILLSSRRSPWLRWTYEAALISAHFSNFHHREMQRFICRTMTEVKPETARLSDAQVSFALSTSLSLSLRFNLNKVSTRPDRKLYGWFHFIERIVSQVDNFVVLSHSCDPALISSQWERSIFPWAITFVEIILIKSTLSAAVALNCASNSTIIAEQWASRRGRETSARLITTMRRRRKAKAK